MNKKNSPYNFDYNYFAFHIDYLVTGLTYDPTKHISMEPENIWTHLWLEDCLDQGKIAPTQFFHLPITLEPDFKPCKDVVIGKFHEIFVKFISRAYFYSDPFLNLLF